jgi:tRNA(fMet)-specific endonuclease VapC
VFILDTDAITRHQNAHTVLSARVSSTPPTQLFTTSVTVEEQLKGRLSYLNTHRNDPRKSAQGHAALVRTVYYFNQWNILLFDEETDTIFRQLRLQRIRIGSQDLRIAAIALLHGFTVVTSNTRDFAQVSNLKVEDWTASDPQ